MPFKDISYLEPWQPLCSGDRNDLCNFGRRHPEEQFCEIIKKLTLWFEKKFSLKDFSYLEVWRSLTNLCNFRRRYYNPVK